MSYYFWGNAIAVYFGYLYFYKTVIVGGKSSKKRYAHAMCNMSTVTACVVYVIIKCGDTCVVCGV